VTKRELVIEVAEKLGYTQNEASDVIQMTLDTITEALAEYVHKRIRHELGHGAEDAPDMHDLLKQNYRGSRYSFGYPACPNLSDQRQLLTLLGADRIGVTLTEEDQLDPEQSTSALVILHPKAKYFSV